MKVKFKSLREKYSPEVCNKLRGMFDDDVQAWSRIKYQGELDVQCLHTGSDDPQDVAGPWPQAEWDARHAVGQSRPCLHEDVLTQCLNQVINPIESNPMGVEAQPAGGGADTDTAQFIEGRIRQWEYENHSQVAYFGAAREAGTRSYGFWINEIYYRDKFNQKLCCEAVSDPDTIVPGFWKKPDASDLRRCWQLERMTHEKFKERWPNAEIKSFDGLDRTTNVSRWIDDTTVQVVALWHFDTDERELLAMDIDDESGEYAQVYRDEVKEVDESKVLNSRKEKTKKVIKTIFNGVEALEETEFPDPGDPDDGVDPEIPVYIVTGRMRYERGEKIIESVVRKGRTGQLLYDYLISAIQETIALTPRVVRTGPEGSFDTSSDWNPRSITPYKEYKITYNEQGQPNPAPIVEMYNPPIAALEQAKQSILLSIQNATGVISTERKNRSAESGKAIDALTQEIQVGSEHYFASLRIAQERQYRACARILPVIEKDRKDKIAIRDKFGKHSMVDPNYQGRHAVQVSAGKHYQDLQDKQEEFAEQLLKVGGDPAIVIIALMGAAKMKGIGAYGDQIYEVLSRLLVKMQPELADLFPDAQPKGQPGQDPKVIAQQAQQAVQALNAKIHSDEQKIVALMHERDAKILEIQAKASEGDKDRANKLQIAEINASTKENMDTLAQQVQAMKGISDFLTERMGYQHEAQQNELDRQHAQALQGQQQEAAAASQDSAQSHAADQQEQQLAAQPAAQEQQ